MAASRARWSGALCAPGRPALRRGGAAGGSSPGAGACGAAGGRCAALSFAAHSPLGRGVLTGSVQTPDALPPEDRRRDHPRFQGENLSRNCELLRHVEAIARDTRCTTGQLVLA